MPGQHDPLPDIESSNFERLHEKPTIKQFFENEIMVTQVDAPCSTTLESRGCRLPNGVSQKVKNASLARKFRCEAPSQWAHCLIDVFLSDR